MAVTQVGTPGTVVTQSGSNTGTVTGAFSGTQPRTAGDLLVAVVTAYGTTSAGAISNTGATWTQKAAVTASSVAETTIWTLIAAGADAAPTFTATMVGTAASELMTCFLIELTGTDLVTPVAATGTNTGTIGTLTVTTGANVPATGCYAISGWNIVSASNTTTWTPGASWTNASTTGATTAVDHAMCDIFSSPPASSTLAEIGTHGVTSTFQSGAILVARPYVKVLPVTFARQAVKRASLW